MPPENEMLREIRDDVKTLIKFQAQTEQRLQHGAQTFQDHEVRIRSVEAKPSVKPKLVYCMVIIGFAALGLLISLWGLN